ncbi:hypothetical protein WN943_004999 [Citrus x changshan-huyou]
MDGSASRAQAIIKPVLLKAGVPLAISVAGFICAKMMARKDDKVSSLKSDSYEKFRDDESCHSLNSTSSSFKEDEEIITNSKLKNYKRGNWRQMQFARYHDLKEQESLLMELRNMILLEKSYVELLDREVSSVESENKRLENLVVLYLKVLDQLQHWKSESGLLKRKVKKLVRKTKELSDIIREQNLKIESADAELLRNCDVLEEKSNAIQKLENELKELHSVIDQLQEQNSELLNKLQEWHQSASSVTKIEDEGTTMENYRQLLNECEQLQKDRAAEAKELIYLRWANACLRHELMRNQAQQEQNQEKNRIVEFVGGGGIGDYGIEQHLDGLDMGNVEPCYNVANEGSRAGSKRSRLLKRLKRWVDGSEKMKCKFDEKEKHEIKCFGRHSVCSEAEEEHTILARKSCSSA